MPASIRAAGRTQTELQNAIVDALKSRAIEPQVLVSLAKQETSMINVLGDVKSGGRLPALQGGERILDTLTRAGGPTSPGPDVWVILERGGKRALSPFGALIYEPRNNIYTHPKDTIYLYTEPQTFLSFGALGAQRQNPFGAWRITLAEAMARVGGLNDAQSDPHSVFLYRGEPRETLEAIGVKTSQFQGPVIPVVYNVNLKDPSGFFLATQFEMRNKDVIYVSNALSVEASKFRDFMSTLYGTATDPMNAAITLLFAKERGRQVRARSASLAGGGGTTVVAPPPVP